jgi:hypothetical protein
LLAHITGGDVASQYKTRISTPLISTHLLRGGLGGRTWSWAVCGNLTVCASAWQQKLLVQELDPRGDAPDAPVLDALDTAAPFVVTQALGELRRPAQMINQFAVVHGSELNTVFTQKSTPCFQQLV